MFDICHHIMNLQKPYNAGDFSYQGTGDFYSNYTIDEIIIFLDETLRNYTLLEVIEENFGEQRKPFLRFRYNDLECELCDNYDTQRDYSCVRIKHIPV